MIIESSLSGSTRKSVWMQTSNKIRILNWTRNLITNLDHLPLKEKKNKNLDESKATQSSDEFFVCGFPIQNTRTNLTDYLQGTRSSQKLFEKNRNFFPGKFLPQANEFWEGEKNVASLCDSFFSASIFLGEKTSDQQI